MTDLIIGNFHCLRLSVRLKIVSSGTTHLYWWTPRVMMILIMMYICAMIFVYCIDWSYFCSMFDLLRCLLAVVVRQSSSCVHCDVGWYKVTWISPRTNGVNPSPTVDWWLLVHAAILSSTHSAASSATSDFHSIGFQSSKLLWCEQNGLWQMSHGQWGKKENWQNGDYMETDIMDTSKNSGTRLDMMLMDTRNRSSRPRPSAPES